MLVRLANIPFLYQPTYGDVIGFCAIRATRTRSWIAPGFLGTASANGSIAMVAATRVSRLRPGDGADFSALAHWLKAEHDIVAEGGFAPEDDRPRAPLSRDPRRARIDDIIAEMDDAFEGFVFTRVYPRRSPRRSRRRSPQ
jgi:hypothetical protein